MKITQSSLPSSSLRAFAFDLLSRRDGLQGWRPYRSGFRASSTSDRPTIEALARTRLAALLTHAYESSDYYRELWNRVGFRPSPTIDLDVFSQLPFVTKDIIRAKKEQMVSTRFARTELELSYTGGTTGAQTSFYMDRRCKVTRVGRQWGIFERCGYSPGMRRALVWGVHDELPASGAAGGLKALFRRYASGDEPLCCTVMDVETVLAFHDRLTKFEPQIIYGYPNALLEYARIVKDHARHPPRVGRILTTAERLGPSARSRLQADFGGEVFDLYCTREYGCIGFECQEHRGLHIDSESLWIEIVKDGRPVEPGEIGEIVITDLNNYGMPFVRSRTGDIGALAAAPCPCGLPWPVLMSLDGRDTDLIHRPDGRVVPGLMLTDLLADFPGVDCVQFIQNDVETLDVHLVVDDGFPDGGAVAVEREVRTLMGEQIALRIQTVDQIERNPISGKLREVVSRVNASAEPLAAEVVA